jgi:hypothetical protein
MWGPPPVGTYRFLLGNLLGNLARGEERKKRVEREEGETENQKR